MGRVADSERDDILELRREFREVIGRFSDTLDDIKGILNDHSILITKLGERDEEHKRNIERFWASDWRRMEAQCQAHQSLAASSERALLLLQAEVTNCTKVLAETVTTVQDIQKARWKLAGAMGVIAFLAGVAGSILAS